MAIAGFNIGQGNDQRESLRFVDESRDPYKDHQNKPVKLSLAGGTGFVGIYRGLQENGNYRLQPSYVDEIESLNGEEIKRKWVLVEDRPTLISSDRGVVLAVVPVREEQFRSLEGM